MKRILSLAGGGTRGVLQAEYLNALQNDLSKPLVDYFDIFSGTSVGGINVLCLVNAKMSTEQVVGLYADDIVNTIFDKSIFDKVLGMAQPVPQFDGKGKLSVLQKYMKDIELGDTSKMVLIPAYNVSYMKPKFFKTTNVADKGIKIYEIANATSAAPVYFPPHFVDDAYYCDGGVFCNLPVLPAYAEFRGGYGFNEEVKVLSIGTGELIPEFHKLVETAENMGGVSWLRQGLLDMMMDIKKDVKIMYNMLGDNYFHLDFIVPENNFAMDNPEKRNIDELKHIAKAEYISSRDRVLSFLGV